MRTDPWRRLLEDELPARGIEPGKVTGRPNDLSLLGGRQPVQPERPFVLAIQQELAEGEPAFGVGPIQG